MLLSIVEEKNDDINSDPEWYDRDLGNMRGQLGSFRLKELNLSLASVKILESTVENDLKAV